MGKEVLSKEQNKVREVALKPIIIQIYRRPLKPTLLYSCPDVLLLGRKDSTYYMVTQS